FAGRVERGLGRAARELAGVAQLRDLLGGRQQILVCGVDLRAVERCDGLSAAHDRAGLADVELVDAPADPRADVADAALVDLDAAEQTQIDAGGRDALNFDGRDPPEGRRAIRELDLIADRRLAERDQIHAADRTLARLRLADLRVHRAGPGLVAARFAWVVAELERGRAAAQAKAEQDDDHQHDHREP